MEDSTLMASAIAMNAMINTARSVSCDISTFRRLTACASAASACERSELRESAARAC
jgi:hypothetical protein